MSEQMHKQNADVLRTLEDTCKFKPEQLNEISGIISNALGIFEICK